uniref:Uncharacterized protein n=1 Tax=Solanum lycopersicum TaxID=4081 RepID=A0A3Q7H174_SOLLC|nr:uncharacterized protein LOC104648006 [Solanum lycopersicum]XP_010322367.1 uncharacterized protein LOC104648007 [Solanum lycopersicum]
MSSDDSRVMEARVQFVKSRIQPVIEDMDKKIKHLELSLATMNGEMKLKSLTQPITEYVDNEIKHLELLIAIINTKIKLHTAHRFFFPEVGTICHDSTKYHTSRYAKRRN